MYNKKNKSLFVSPHLDDAVLSCGGLIHKMCEAHSVVYVVSIFTGLPNPKSLSEAAIEFHRSIQLGDNAIEVRCSEDLKVSKFLKYHPIHLGLFESQYRQNEQGEHTYKSLDSIFKGQLEEEKTCILQLAPMIKDLLRSHSFDDIYVPMGVGNHIDHLIVRHVLEKVGKEGSLCDDLIYYEDMPYACYEGHVVPERHFKKKMKAYLEPLSETNFNTKIKGISLYKSQINMLWQSQDNMVKSYIDYSHSTSEDKGKLYERYWTNS
ncbi:MAG: PIG-L family deacetylase [Alphaproteobacteria bacterium]|nr:PIG-L family deacetylase [Alphaproteobacteria bacterium]